MKFESSVKMHPLMYIEQVSIGVLAHFIFNTCFTSLSTVTKETLEKRTEDKLLEKTNWYKENKKRKLEDKESKYSYHPPSKKRKGRGIKNTTTKAGGQSKIKAVMFIPFTKHSELAIRLRENEEQMEKMSGYRMKIVEKGGTKLVDMLHKANPWAGEECGRRGCLLCATKKELGLTNSQDCKRRNCVYETTCITCNRRQDQETEDKFSKEGKKRIDEEKRRTRRYRYIGETNRSPYERGVEHQNDVGACKTSSHMLRHLIDVHEAEEEDWDQIKFGMRIVKSTQSAFERQIMESVEIQKARKTSYILNAKSEYNRCALPRLTAKLGEKDLERWRKADREEMEKEASLEEKIRMRKKAKAKDRGNANRRMEQGQPSRKKMRMAEDKDPADDTTQDEPKQPEKKGIVIDTPQKRKVNKEEQGKKRTPKKARRNDDMRKYITCRRWREDEERETGEGTQEEGEEERKAERPESGTRTGGGGEVPQVGGLIQEEEEKDQGQGQHHQQGEVNMNEIAKSMTATLKTKWKGEKNKIEREGILDRIGSWSNQDLKVHMLGWLCTRTDKQIKEEAIEMVGALEEVANTSNVTRKGESIMTDIVEMCTLITEQVNTTIIQPISPPQESSEAFARIGLVHTEGVGPKKLKTSENHQPGPAVEPLLGGGEGGE